MLLASGGLVVDDAATEGAAVDSVGWLDWFGQVDNPSSTDAADVESGPPPTRSRPKSRPSPQAGASAKHIPARAGVPRALWRTLDFGLERARRIMSRN